MFVANRCSRLDPSQVFQRECLARYDGFVYQGLRDAVVHVLLEAAFPARILSEAAFGVLGIDASATAGGAGGSGRELSSPARH